MSRRACWDRLGIAETTDVAAIRRAYAVRLKTIDLDRDADGFQALRDARDEAMHLATLPPGAASDEDADEAPSTDDRGGVLDDAVLWGVGDIAAELDAETVIAAPASDQVEADSIDERDAPYHALYAWLDPDNPDRERHFPSGDEDAAIRAAFDAILDDPRMEQVDFYAHQEQWLANVIALSWPTSESLIEPAVLHFNWNARAGEIGQNPAADFAVNRAAALRFVRAVEAPSHPDHRAWRELTKPASERSRRNWFVRAKSVNALLQTIHRDYPTLEGYLDPWRVSLWETDGGRDSVKTRLAGWLVAVIIINILIRIPFGDVLKPGPADYTLTQAIADSSYGAMLSAADIARANPTLHGRLMARFERERLTGLKKESLAADIDQTLNGEAQNALIDAPYPVLQAKARLQRGRAVAARELGWDQCVAVLFDEGNVPEMPERLDGQVNALRKLALLTPKRLPATIMPPHDSGRLDPDIAERIRRQAGLSDRVYADALMNKGQASDRCEARIAAIEVVLSLPRARAEPLLRVLVG